jgi:uncharacterized protein DUF4926
MEELDVVKIKKDLAPDLKIGATGTIVHKFKAGQLFIVEFPNNELYYLCQSEIELVYKAPKGEDYGAQ